MHEPRRLEQTIYLAQEAGALPLGAIVLPTGQTLTVITGLLGAATPALIRTLAPAMVILDTGTPSMVSAQLGEDIRVEYRGPLVVLAGDYSESHHIQWLAHGADDFIAKPISPPLLAAKVSALLRSVDRLQGNRGCVIRFGDLAVDTRRRTVIFQGRDAMLTAIEYDIFSYLLNNSGRIVSRNDVHLALYNSEHNGYDRSIDIYISRIRHKIGDHSAAPKYLKTIRGTGYLFVGRDE